MSKRSIAQFERFYRLKAQKICVQCGSAPAREDRNTCKSCGRKQSMRVTEHYERNKRKSKCAIC